VAARAVIFGCRGQKLTAEERTFFKEAEPWGFILFDRNCDSPGQVRGLVTALRDCLGRDDAPVLIDQEGGRVQRLKPPHWRSAPPAARFGALYERDPERAREALKLDIQLIAAELTHLGITVDCLPVLDVPVKGANNIIGDRAFSTRPEVVAELGRVACEALLEAGVLPVIKHMPGHGRAVADSHVELPRVMVDRATLEASDFVPFRTLADMPLAMTAHVLYGALDADHAATVSPAIIGEVIRGHIGFDGLLMSDDISANMKALAGSYRARAERALAAGCDVLLHCNGERAEMEEVVEAVPLLAGAAGRRADAALERLNAPQPLAADEAVSRLNALLGSSA
jgi:beta-N-acetylhexosaminidase